MKLNNFLHGMYILLSAGAMLFWSFGRDFIGTILFLFGIGIWAVMFGTEIKDNH